MAGLYIHIPFCVRKCPYCDFYSVAYTEKLAEEYTAAVLRNIESYGERFGKIPVETVYFGGGTPSLFPPRLLGEIIRGAEKHFMLDSQAEISFEANPGTVDLVRLKELRAAGFNRISFGVQSMNDEELKALGRLHDSSEAEKAVRNAHEAGFENISADLMLGIIGQTEKTLKESVERLSALPLTHISAYILKIEQGTPYDRQEIYNRIADEDKVADLYLTAVHELEKHGFLQYEISNFAKKDFPCEHNLKYWRCEEYIGIGPAAHSYFNGKRYGVARSLEDFLAEKVQKEGITDENPGGFFEYAMLKFRLSEGLDLDECTKKFGVDKDMVLKKIIPMERAGFVKRRKTAISLTPEGCLVSNEIIVELFGEM